MIEIGIGPLDISFAYCLADFCRAHRLMLNFLLGDLLGFKSIFLPPAPQLPVISLLIKSEMMIETSNYNFCLQVPVKVIPHKLLACGFCKLFSEFNNDQVIKACFTEKLKFFLI